MSPPRRPTVARTLCSAVRACLPLMCAMSAAHPATCTVTSNVDDPADASDTVTGTTTAGTLRDCILAANLLTGTTGVPTGAMAIDLSGIAGQTIVLGNALPLVFNNAIIDAGDGSPVTIDGADTHRIFFVSGLPSIPSSGKPDADGAQTITVRLRNLRLQHGFAQGGDACKHAGAGMGAGGALFVNRSANVTLEQVSLDSNAAAGGMVIGSTCSGGGGGMGAGTSFGAGGGGLGAASLGGGGGIGTSGTATAAGGWSGQGLGQISNAQGFTSADFDVDTGNGVSGLGLIGGGGFWNDDGGFGGGGGVGGDGGFGGGGGVAMSGYRNGSFYHGNGGFGGGGGYSNSLAGIGGFGGGSAIGTGIAYHAGTGGGAGGIDGGGGGAGFGGAIFVRGGGTLTVRHTGSGRVENGLVSGGQGYRSGGTGAAAGTGFFLMSGATTTFDIAGTYTIADALGDDSPSTISACCDFKAGNGAGAAIVKQGAGALILSGRNSYLGMTSINAGTLGGNGTLAGPVMLASGARLAPGDPATAHGVGVLTAGSSTWASGGLMSFQLGAKTTNSDFFFVKGDLNKSGVGPFKFHFGIGSSPPIAGTTYTLITSTDSNAFSSDDFSFDYDSQYQNLTGHFDVVNGRVNFTVEAVASDHIFADEFD